MTYRDDGTSLNRDADPQFISPPRRQYLLCYTLWVTDLIVCIKRVAKLPKIKNTYNARFVKLFKGDASWRVAHWMTVAQYEGSWCGQSKPTIRASRTMTSHLRWEKTLNTLPPNWNEHTSGPIAWGKGGECYVWRFLVLRYIIIRAYCPTIDTRETATGRRQMEATKNSKMLRQVLGQFGQARKKEKKIKYRRSGKWLDTFYAARWWSYEHLIRSSRAGANNKSKAKYWMKRSLPSPATWKRKMLAWRIFAGVQDDKWVNWENRATIKCHDTIQEFARNRDWSPIYISIRTSHPSHCW